MRKKLLVLFCISISITTIQAQTDWELLNPKPTANTGKDIAFVSKNIGYIITSNELLETQDAGTTWLIKQNITSGNDLRFFKSIGYIVGDNGYVLKSVDNGASWSQLFTGFNSSFNTVNIIDETKVILSTSNSIVKTNDGGTTWENLPIPNISVNKSWFTSALVGHAVCKNGTILKTIDGGENWYITEKTNTFPSNFLTVFFINEKIGFASREHDDIFKTTDNGETWVETPGSSSLIYDFHFIDEMTGFASGEFGVLIKTVDGGNTWIPILFQNVYEYNTSMYGIYFQDKNIGYATGARGRIIKTADGGDTWTQYSENYNSISQIDFLSKNVGFGLVGNSFFKTTDGGNSWINIGPPVENVKTFSFDFIDENLGYALVGGTVGSSGNTGSVYKTTNGGISWSRLNGGKELFDENLYAIDFINENIGFVSGGFNRRVVLKTNDGGATWFQVESTSFGHIQFINSQVGYANRIGYSSGRMYKTIDGGNTWNVSIEVDESITSFHFVDENIGYFLGERGLIFKTTDGGNSWKTFSIPYKWFTKVNFYSKNVGYIADEDGKLYKTENGGINWQYLTQQYIISSIEIINDKIYIAGSNGKIYRSKVEYEPIVLSTNPTENITNTSASLSGNVTSNSEPISNIQFEYSIDSLFSNTIASTPNTVASNEAINVSIDLENLASNTTYYYRLKALQNSNINTSEISSFKTLPDYEISKIFISKYSSTTAVISGKIISNGYDITNVELQYGTSSDVFDNSSHGTPSSVLGNTTENFVTSLINLNPETKYYLRIKASHKGEDIYSNIQSFTTYPRYRIDLNNPIIYGTDVILSAYLSSYDKDITDIVFEYGTIDFESDSSTTPKQVIANSTAYVSNTIGNLDTSLNYYYRLKATHNGEAIYSEERVFNFTGKIIIVSGKINEVQSNSLELVGLINSYGAYLTNIHFEYGVTPDLGFSIESTPNLVYGFSTNSIAALINDVLPYQTYYYRLVANNDGKTIYSETYQFKPYTLSLSGFDEEKWISIYPNPVNDILNLKSNTPYKIESVLIYNTLGQSIYTENVSGFTDLKIDVSNLKKGVYFVKVRFKNTKEVTSKFVLI